MSRVPLGWVIGLSALGALACSSGADESPVPLSTAPGATSDLATPSVLPTATARSAAPTEAPFLGAGPPAATPGAVVTATSDSEPTPVGGNEPSPPPEPEVDLTALTVPFCRTESSSSNSNGFGTVPHATATPLPKSGEPGQPSPEKATAFVAVLRPLYDALISVIQAGDESWSRAELDQGRAGSISYEGRRLSHICSALSTNPRTIDSESLFSRLAGALESRRDALFDAAESLRSPGGDIAENVVERVRTTLDILAFGAALEDYAASSGVADSAGGAGYSIVNPLLGLTVEIAPGWVTVRNGIDVFIAAPPGIQRFSVSGLGPDAWKLGTALRIRRFRNETGLMLEDAVETLDGLLVRFGSRIDEFDFNIGGERGVRLTYSTEDGYWRTFVGAIVVADATYLFEVGCPTEFIGECEGALDVILGSVMIAGR